MKAYVLTFNSALSDQHVHQILNSSKAIDTWLSPYQSTVIVLSRLTVSELAAVLQTHFLGIWFLVVEVTKDNSNGWLPPQFWEYIADPYKAWSSKILAGLLTNPPPPPPPPPSLGLNSLFPKK
jgi:hypothetical protein